MIEPSSPFNVDIPIRATAIEMDELGNIYILTTQNALIKYNHLGEQLYDYRPVSNGDISFIDVHNPHKILVFFNDFQLVKFLDNTLSEISTFDLSTVSDEVTQVILSNDNNLWIYDVVDSRIKKISTQNEVLIQTEPISTIVHTVFHPNFLSEINNSIYIYDPAQGFLVFNFAGHMIKRYPLFNKNLKYIEGDRIVYIMDKKIHLDNIDNAELRPRTVELGYQVKDVCFYNKKWYLLTNRGIIIKPDNPLNESK